MHQAPWLQWIEPATGQARNDNRHQSVVQRAIPGNPEKVLGNKILTKIFYFDNLIKPSE
jgi:hypothetical protein